MIPTWRAKNKGGKIFITNKDMFEMYLCSLPEDVQVVVKKPVKQRSINQNDYYWSVPIQLISDHTGYLPEEVHEFLKLKFNNKTINVGNDEVVVGLSTASLKTMEFETYISKIVMWASQTLGIIIPNPNDDNTR
jgi:hypothetical protein